MKEIAFTAKAVAATVLPTLNTHLVAFAEEADGDGARLEIQRALSPAQQDIKNGHDTYCLSTQSGASVYGGMLAYRFDGRVISIDLDAIAEETLGVEPSFSILLDVDYATIDQVRTALASILRELRPTP